MAESNKSRSWAPAPVGPVRHSSGTRSRADQPEPVQRLRLLVVDDDAALRRALARALSAHYEVYDTDAVSALAAIRSGEHFDAMLSDVSMPVLSGIMLFQAVEEVSASLASRTILMSGGADAFSRDFIARKKLPLLAKPISIAAFREIVSSLCAPPDSEA
jgi:DNA-binding NtrC family response regulator